MNKEIVLRDQTGDDYVLVAVFRPRAQQKQVSELSKAIEARLGERYVHILLTEGGRRLAAMIHEERCARIAAEDQARAAMNEHRLTGPQTEATIDELPLLSTRARKVLRHAGIFKIRTLTGMTADELSSLPQCGRGTLLNIRESLQERGLDLLKAPAA